MEKTTFTIITDCPNGYWQFPMEDVERFEVTGKLLTLYLNNGREARQQVFNLDHLITYAVDTVRVPDNSRKISRL